MTFNSPISMLQSVLTKLPDVLPANFFNIDWGKRGIVTLGIKSCNLSIVPRYFGQNCSCKFCYCATEFQEKLSQIIIFKFLVSLTTFYYYQAITMRFSLQVTKIVAFLVSFLPYWENNG